MWITGKRVLVTGGTGSFGQFIVRRLLDHDAAEIRILSRDEKKHYDMRHHYAKEATRLTFITGDIRDERRVRESMHGCHAVFQAAALKHVYNCEEHPYEAVMTNVIGTENVVTVALDMGVERIVTVSTDKAVKPVNVMGMTKAIQERLVIAANRAPRRNGTLACCVRYGNVMSSRGSAIPFFRELAARRKPITITHPEMTRFLLTLNDAIDLVLFAVENMEGGETFIRKAPAVRIMDLARVIAAEVDAPFDPVIIGMIPGEKLHEILISEEELNRAVDLGGYYVVRPHWMKQSRPTVEREYSSAENLVTADEDIKALLAKSDAEFSDLGIKGTFFK
jgi:UDP-N-acetylglucosamine 4,6-dehydratase/5-epimerase